MEQNPLGQIAEEDRQRRCMSKGGIRETVHGLLLERWQVLASSVLVGGLICSEAWPKVSQAGGISSR